jgi:hypothetical protein
MYDINFMETMFGDTCNNGTCVKYGTKEGKVCNIRAGGQWASRDERLGKQ